MKKLLMGILLLGTASAFAADFKLSCEDDIKLVSIGHGVGEKVNDLALVDGEFTRIKGKTHDLLIGTESDELFVSIVEKETEDGSVLIASAGFKLEVGNRVNFYFNNGETSVNLHGCKIK